MRNKDPMNRLRFNTKASEVLRCLLIRKTNIDQQALGSIREQRRISSASTSENRQLDGDIQALTLA